MKIDLAMWTTSDFESKNIPVDDPGEETSFVNIQLGVGSKKIKYIL